MIDGIAANGVVGDTAYPHPVSKRSDRAWGPSFLASTRAVRPATGKHQWLDKRSQAYTEIIAELWKLLLLDDQALWEEGPRGLGHRGGALLAPIQPTLFRQHHSAPQQVVSRGSGYISQEVASQLAQYLHEIEQLVDRDDAYADVRYASTRARWVTMREFAQKWRCIAIAGSQQPFSLNTCWKRIRRAAPTRAV